MEFAPFLSRQTVITTLYFTVAQCERASAPQSLLFTARPFRAGHLATEAKTQSSVFSNFLQILQGCLCVSVKR